MKFIANLLWCLCLFAGFQSFAQETSGSKQKSKGKLYLAWGYNKDWYSKSDLHFKSKSVDNYDFTIYDAIAEDRPNFDKIFQKNISIPQFIYRVGYMFGSRPDMGIEIGFDHAKYIMIANQKAHVKGTIHESYVDKDTIISPEFVRFEHTNGANFLMVSFVKKNKLYSNASGKSQLFANIKPGMGIVIPQSEVALFGVDQNNNYHIAGYVMGLDCELHYELLQHIVFETGFKGVYANYIDVLSVADAKANHHFFCLEWLISIGYQFSL